MGKVDLPYITSWWCKRTRKWRFFVRRRGKKVPVKGTPGTPAFQRSYQDALGIAEEQAEAARGPTHRESLRWLCERYMASAEFGQLDQSTRHVRKLIIDRLCAETGDLPYAKFQTKHFRAMRDARAKTPEAANGVVKALRAVYRWAVEVGHVETNPARDVPLLRSHNPDGHHTWTLAEVEQYRERHPVGTKARLALELLLFTGCRRSDVVTLGRQMARDGWLCFDEQKGQSRKVKARAIPILPELKAVIDATPSGHLTYLCTEFGRPYTANGFGNWFRRQCDAAGLPHCSAHGLRKAGATFAAEAGATEHQLMAIYGWESPKQAALYTRKANKRKLAGSGMQFLVKRDE